MNVALYIPVAKLFQRVWIVNILLAFTVRTTCLAATLSFCINKAKGPQPFQGFSSFE